MGNMCNHEVSILIRVGLTLKSRWVSNLRFRLEVYDFFGELQAGPVGTVAVLESCIYVPSTPDTIFKWCVTYASVYFEGPGRVGSLLAGDDKERHSYVWAWESGRVLEKIVLSNAYRWRRSGSALGSTNRSSSHGEPVSRCQQRAIEQGLV